VITHLVDMASLRSTIRPFARPLQRRVAIVSNSGNRQGPHAHHHALGRDPDADVEEDGDLITLDHTADGFDLYCADSLPGSAPYEVVISVPYK
jgi:hypothetical protein